MTERSTPSSGEAGAAEIRSGEAGPSEASATDAGSREAGSSRARSRETSATDAGSREPGSSRAGSREAGSREAGAAGGARTVTTVAELKALADPLRLAILDALTSGARRELRVLSVKELAAELGEPKTKLYRHIKLLEAAGLIRVAATRLVSGIVEQRYQACQVDLVVGPWARREPGEAEQAADFLVDFTLDRYRRRYLDYLASLPPGPPAEDRSWLAYKTMMVSPARARIIRDKLREVAAEFDGPRQPGDDAGDAVKIETLVSYMTTG